MLRRLASTPDCAARGGVPASGEPHRCTVERRTWSLANRRVTVRYERRTNILTAFLHSACAYVRPGSHTDVKLPWYMITLCTEIAGALP